MARHKLSVYISYLLRHQLEAIGLAMDSRGWVMTTELIEKINAAGKYRTTQQMSGMISMRSI